EQGKKVIVGVNRFTVSVQTPPEMLVIGPDIEERQNKSVAEVRANRDDRAAEDAIQSLKEMAHDKSQNSIPVLVAAAEAYVTLGEMVETLKGEWGVYTEPPMF
ncbi:MAG: methylmalonyl-CoA mutase family protein, partial [Actinomycetota bacterium]